MNLYDLHSAVILFGVSYTKCCIKHEKNWTKSLSVWNDNHSAQCGVMVKVLDKEWEDLGSILPSVINAHWMTLGLSFSQFTSQDCCGKI